MRIGSLFILDKIDLMRRKQAYTVMNSVLKERMNRTERLDKFVQVTYNSFSNVYD